MSDLISFRLHLDDYSRAVVGSEEAAKLRLLAYREMKENLKLGVSQARLEQCIIDVLKGRAHAFFIFAKAQGL